MKKLIFYSGIALLAVSCATQKYSRTDNNKDDVYFSPSVSKVQLEDEEKSRSDSDGFHYDLRKSTANPNASYHRYQANGATASNGTNSNPASSQPNTSSNYTTNSITNNYYSNGFNSYGMGYSPWAMSGGFGCRTGFNMGYSPVFGSGMSYSPCGSFYNPWNYYPPGYSPYYGYSGGYGYNSPYGYGYQPSSYYQPSQGTIHYQNNPRITGGSIIPSTIYGSGRRTPYIPMNPVHPGLQLSDEMQTNPTSPGLRGIQGAPEISPGNINPTQRPAPSQDRPAVSPSNTPQNREPQRNNPPQRREPQNANPPQHQPQAPAIPQVNPPQRREPSKTNSPQTPSNPTRNPSANPSTPSRNGGSNPQPRR